MIVRVNLPLIGNGSLAYVAGQPRSSCAKFCSCHIFRSILATAM